MGLQEHMKKANAWMVAHKMLTSLMVVVLVVLFVVLVIHVSKKSGFTDPNDIRRYVVGLDGLTMDDKINAARQKALAASAPASAPAAPAASTMTGTRDIPVFFQDFGIEVDHDASGNLVTNRGETLAGSKDEIADIEKKFMLGG